MSTAPHLPSDRERAISSALSQIEKLCGSGSVMRFGDKRHIGDLEVISTGSLGLDMALGVGGLACGRIVEIYGPESSGKTTLALHIMAEAQRLNGGVVGFIDAEHAFSPTYAQKIGVQLKDLIISQPDSGEQALEIADKLVSSSAINVLVIDSVAALVPKAELEGNMGDSHMGLQARMMGQALRKLVGPVSKSKCLVVFINQTRQKIGVVFGNPETTTGGQALKFYASVRLDIRRTSTLKDKDTSVGNQTRVKIVKNKLAAPFRVVDFDILYGEGISREGEIIDWASKLGILDKAGSWYSFQGTRLGQGRESTRRFLKEHANIAETLIQKIRAHEAIDDEFLKEERSGESESLSHVPEESAITATLPGTTL